MALSPGQIEGLNNLPVRTATWNTKTIIVNDTINLLINKIERMEIYIFGITETHWTTDIPKIWEKDENVIIHSPRQDGIPRQGVALILNKKLSEHMINYECISSRLLKVTIELKSDRITYFVMYAPYTSYEDTYVEEFLYSKFIYYL